MTNVAGMTFLSGDQNGLGWDVPLKLAVLSRRGASVTHTLHTIDLFSRPPSGSSNVIEVTKEAYTPHGNVNRWTASLEAAPFLGQMPIPPHEFVSLGINLSKVAAFHRQSVEKTVTQLSEGEWRGLSLRDDGRIAHDVNVKELMAGFSDLRRPMRHNIKDTVDPASQAAALGIFDQLFGYNPDSGPWPVAANAVLNGTLQRLGAKDNVTLSTSLDLLSGQDFGNRSKILVIFLDHYHKARDAYNQALKDSHEKIMPLEDGELPFYAVVRDKAGRLRRVDLHYQPGITLTGVKLQASKHGEVLALAGKAIPQLVDLMQEHHLVLTERASSYADKVVRFVHLLRQATGMPLKLHPVVRVRLKALDCLSEVRHTFRLPLYLREAFGTELISGIDFARQWREVVETSGASLASLAGANTHEVICALRNQKRLASSTCELIAAVQHALQICLEKRKQSEGRDVLDNLKVLKHTLAAVMEGVEAERAQAMQKHLAITLSLPYWNCRPFCHWVEALPGWADAIIRNAEVVVDPLFSGE